MVLKKETQVVVYLPQSSKRILLLGAAGKTGLWYSRLLLADGHFVTGYDAKSDLSLPSDITSHKQFHLVQGDIGGQTLLANIDYVTLTPGVALSHPTITKALELGLPVFTEVEYTAARICERYRIIGITGTDGKSTTTALTAALFNEQGVKALACGNFGIPFSQILLQSDIFSENEFLICEMSSYQLEQCRGLTFEASALLNAAPDHLNRYAGFADYVLTKWNIYFATKFNGTFVVNKSLLLSNETTLKERHPMKMAAQPHCHIRSIDVKNLSGPNFAFIQEQLTLTAAQKSILSKTELALQGVHNHGNILFALELLYAALPDYDAAKVASTLKNFGGLPHRYERVVSSDGNYYINDSKATTTQAAITALRAAPAPVLLFLGGQGKGEDYALLADEVLAKGAVCFIYGSEKEKLAAALKKAQYNTFGNTFIFNDLKQAFMGAQEYQRSHKLERATYLLAPAVTSWDQFSSFEERGDFFKELVQAI